MSLAQPRRSLACIAGMAVLLGAACTSPIKTAHDSDPEADFSRYKSYAWIKDGPLIGPSVGEVRSSYISPIDDQRIRTGVEGELAAKGYSEAASREQADLIVSYSIGTQEKTRVRQDPGRSSVYYPGYGYGGWYGGSTVSVQQYTEGTLARLDGERPAVHRGHARDRVLGSSQQAGGLGGLGVEAPVEVRRLERDDPSGRNHDARAVPAARSLSSPDPSRPRFPSRTLPQRASDGQPPAASSALRRPGGCRRSPATGTGSRAPAWDR